MEKDHLGENLSLSGKRKEEHLEISSTGYGLESVSSQTTNESEEREVTPPSCGGL